MSDALQIVRMPFEQALSLGEGLTERHYDEVPLASGKLPLELDVEKYRALEEGGYLMTFVAFHEGRVIGYILVLAFPLLHHRGHWSAQTDSFYVHPEYRRQGVLEQLLLEATRVCTDAGISTFQFVTNENFKAAEQVAERVGAAPLERSYIIELGE